MRNKKLLKERLIMKKENRDLLESLIEGTLKEAMGNTDDNYKALEAAMKLIDRQLELDKQELEIEKLKMTQEHDKNRDEKKHQYELENETNRQEHELNAAELRQQFELLMQDNKNNAESERQAEAQDHEFNLEVIKQKFKMKELNVNKKIEEAKMKLENDQAAKDRLIKCGEIALAVIVTPMIEAGCKKAFAKMICDFEKDYNFTTMAGRSLSAIFKFKK